jgi:hypothetical protein
LALFHCDEKTNRAPLKQKDDSYVTLAAAPLLLLPSLNVHNSRAFPRGIPKRARSNKTSKMEATQPFVVVIIPIFCPKTASIKINAHFAEVIE